MSEQEPVFNSFPASQPEPAGTRTLSKRQWLFFNILVVAIIIAINLTLWGIFFWNRSSRMAGAPIFPLPWSALFTPSHSIHLITSDPIIVAIQQITGGDLSVSNYANRNYIPDPDKQTPEEMRFLRMLLWGDYSASAVDPPIAARIAALAQASSANLTVRAARSIQFSDLGNNDNFIFLGSPRSDPWVALFDNQLDFRFVFDKTIGREVILNVHPRPHELSTYIPSALGWATRKSFAIIAFIQNPGQNGHVLLLAGADGEGTEAAGKFAADPSRLSPVLQKCGIDPFGRLKYFELLLSLNTLAGSPNGINVVACHILTDQLAPAKSPRGS
jgi:hypothetical protein